MNQNLINNSIEREKLHLSFSEKFSYFTFPGLLIFGSFLCFTNGFQNNDLSQLNFTEPIPKIGLIIFALGIIYYFLKSKGLKLHSVITSTLDVKQKILQAAEKRNWKIVSEQKKVIILKTPDQYSYHNFPFRNRLTGQLIYIFFTPKKILLTSITDLKASGLIIPNGENSANEKFIINFLKSQPPTAS